MKKKNFVIFDPAQLVALHLISTLYHRPDICGWGLITLSINPAVLSVVDGTYDDMLFLTPQATAVVDNVGWTDGFDRLYLQTLTVYEEQLEFILNLNTHLFEPSLNVVRFVT